MSIKHVINWIVQQPEIARLSPTNPITATGINRIILGDRTLAVTERNGKYHIHFTLKLSKRCRKFGELVLEAEDEKKFQDWFLDCQKKTDVFLLTGESPKPSQRWQCLLNRKNKFLDRLSPEAKEKLISFGDRFVFDDRAFNFPIKLSKINFTEDAGLRFIELLASVGDEAM
jgi:hypothetical protein